MSYPVDWRMLPLLVDNVHKTKLMNEVIQKYNSLRKNYAWNRSKLEVCGYQTCVKRNTIHAREHVRINWIIRIDIIWSQWDCNIMSTKLLFGKRNLCFRLVLNISLLSTLNLQTRHYHLYYLNIFKSIYLLNVVL